MLQTDDFIQIELVGSGVPRLNADGTRAYVTKEPGTVEVYETAFFQMVDTIDLPCSFNDIKAVELLDDGTGFLVLGDDKVCGIGNVDIPSFTCDLSLSFSDQTLGLDFDLGSSEPATWNLALAYFNATASLWSVPLPVVAPPVSFEIPLAGFPSVGKIGFLTTLVTAEGIVCSDWEVIDTGSELGEVANESLRQLLRRLQRNP